MCDLRMRCFEGRCLISDSLQLSGQTLVARPRSDGGSNDLGHHRVEIDQETIDAAAKLIEPVLEIGDELVPLPQRQDRWRIGCHGIGPRPER